MICKHYQTQKGCSFGDKCQFAHGMEDLRANNGIPNPHSMNQVAMNEQKKGPNPQNYKIVKCKYWEKDGTCRYGSLCTFAHGEKEIRTKSDNMNYNRTDGMEPNPMASPGSYPNMPGMNPYMMGMDPNMMFAFENMMGIYQQQDPNQNPMNNQFVNFIQMQQQQQQQQQIPGQNIGMNNQLNMIYQNKKEGSN